MTSKITLFPLVMIFLIALTGCSGVEKVFDSELRAEREQAEVLLAQLSPGMSRREVAQVIGPGPAGINRRNFHTITQAGRHERLVLSEHFQVAATFSVTANTTPQPRESGELFGLDRMLGVAEPAETDTLIAVGKELHEIP